MRTSISKKARKRLKYKKKSTPKNNETLFLTVLSMIEVIVSIGVAFFLARTFYLGVLSGNDKLIFGSLLLFIVEAVYLGCRDRCENRG